MQAAKKWLSSMFALDQPQDKRPRLHILCEILRRSPNFLPGASLVAQPVKNPPAMQEILVQLLVREDPLEKG